MTKEEKNQLAEELIKKMAENDAVRFIYDQKNKKLIDALND